MAHVSIQKEPAKKGGMVTTRDWDPFRAMRELLSWEPFTEMLPHWPAEHGQLDVHFDVKETKEAFIFKADLPGIKSEDLDVKLTRNRLTVTGKREAEKTEKGETFYMYERSFGSFTRAFTLPEGVDAEHIDADLKDGVLTLTLPKKPEVQPKQINVKAK
jgi:HSP20 family protein